MKNNGGFLVTKIKQLGDRIYEKVLAQKGINGVNLTKSTENSIVKPNIRSGPHCSHCSIYKCYFRMISPIDREFISIT